MRITICRDFDIINTFLKDNFSSPTHWPDWNCAVSKYFHSDFFYYILEDNGTVKGVCPIHREKHNGLIDNITGKKEYLLPYGGWILSENIDIPLTGATGFNSAFLGFSLPELSEFKVSYSPDNTAGYDTLILDLRLSEDEIWQNCIESKRRNMIRKAEKSGITIVQYDLNDVTQFYSWLKEVNDRYGLAKFGIEFFQDLFATAVNISFTVLLAMLGEEALSAVVLVNDKNYAIYWLGFTVEGSPNAGQGELLQWDAIKRAKNAGCRYYDLCTIEKDRLPHIYDFKKDFSKQEIRFLSFSSRSFSYKLRNRIARWI